MKAQKARLFCLELLGRYRPGTVAVALLMVISAPMFMASAAVTLPNESDTNQDERIQTTFAAPALLTQTEAAVVPQGASEATAAPETLFSVTVEADGKSALIFIPGGTVAQALQSAGIVLGEEDSVTPDADEIVQEGATITVQRVQYKQRSVTEEIPFEKQTKQDSALQSGTTRLMQKGVAGSREALYRDRYLDGERTESVLLSEKTVQEPVPQITLVGTKQAKLQNGLQPISELPLPKDVQLDENGLPTKYSQVVHGTAKAYAMGSLTASGRKAMPGHIAVDPKQFPYGTRLYIVSSDGKYVYGYCIAADTGGFVQTKGCTVDLRMNSNAQCYEWGHRGVTIYVLD